MDAQGQVVSRTSNAQQTRPKNDSLSYIDGVLDRTSAQLASSRQWATAKASDTLDKTISPAQRDLLSEKTQRFIETSPRLAAFIAVNAVLTGIPLLLFLLFSVSVFVFSLTTGLIIGTISALVFTASAVGLGLCVVFPTVLFTTIAAFLVFFWGLVGVTILRWAANTRRKSSLQRDASLNDQVRNIRYRIAESAEAASEQQSKPHASYPATKDRPKSGSGDTHQPAPELTSRPTTATALPTEKQTTTTVSAGKDDGTSNLIRVPDPSTTGMVAS